jgi:hypothetical protein
MNYFQRMLSNSKDASFGRIGSCAIVTTFLGVCSYLSVKNNLVVDIPLQWAGLATLLYATTKASETFNKEP